MHAIVILCIYIQKENVQHIHTFIIEIQSVLVKYQNIMGLLKQIGICSKTINRKKQGITNGGVEESES